MSMRLGAMVTVEVAVIYGRGCVANVYQRMRLLLDNCCSLVESIRWVDCLLQEKRSGP